MKFVIRIWCCALFAIVGVASTACNHRSPLTTDQFSLPSEVAPTPFGVFGITFSPRAVIGTVAGIGTVILTKQAPDGGTAVTLSSGDPAVTVPGSVTIPAGFDRATFPFSASTVPADRSVPISASVEGVSAAGILPLWAIQPTFFSWFSDAGDLIGRGEFGHVTSATATFSPVTATPESANLLIGVGPGDFWSLSFAPRRGSTLQPGVYEDVVRASNVDATHPGLDIGSGTACSPLTGRFVIREVAFAPNGRVSRLNASFEQHCGVAVPAIRGEIRYNALAP